MLVILYEALPIPYQMKSTIMQINLTSDSTIGDLIGYV